MPHHDLDDLTRADAFALVSSEEPAPSHHRHPDASHDEDDDDHDHDDGDHDHDDPDQIAADEEPFDPATRPDLTVLENGVVQYVSGFGLDDYNIELLFAAPFSEAIIDTFIDAAELVGSLILEDVPDTTFQTGVGIFEDREIDDLVVIAGAFDEDGPGGVLGGATVIETRPDTVLPAVSLIELDVGDLAPLLEAGELFDVVLHETFHAVGFGQVWEDLGLLEVTDDEARYVGEAAVAEYPESFPDVAAADPGSDSGVPVELDGGEGTALDHWEEDLFGREIMTGFLQEANFLSDLTIASLEDLGYETFWEPPLDDDWDWEWDHDHEWGWGTDDALIA